MSAQTYVGLTETPFKTRLLITNRTELIQHVWCLKEAGLKFKFSWKFLKQTSRYNPVSNQYNLCLWEKYFIICRPELATLKKHNVTSCWHTNKFLLKNDTPTIATLQQLLKSKLRVLTTVKFKFPECKLSASYNYQRAL